MWILWSSCSNISHDTKNALRDTVFQKNTIKQTPPKIIYDISLSYEQQQNIESMVNGYFCQYPCDMKILTIGLSNIADKENTTTLAHAKPHCIYLNEKDISNDIALKNTIIHELFHTIKPDTITYIQPYQLKDWYTVIWYHGLSVVVQKWKEKTQFGLFEDAAAEACATTYNKEYSVPNVYYANIWSLLLKMINKWRCTVNDLIAYQSNNGMELFIEKIINKKPTHKNIEILMQIFNDVYSTEEDKTNEAIKKIETIRMK